MMKQLDPFQANLYTGWLDLFKRLTGKDPTYKERTEAYFAAADNRRPYWHNWPERPAAEVKDEPEA